MKHFKYIGQLAFKSNTFRNQELSGSVENGIDDLCTGNLWFSNKQLLKFKSKQYLLFLDGVIYQYDQKLFNEDNYYQLILDFCSNQEMTLRKLNGEFVLILLDLMSSVTWMASGESGNAALFYRVTSVSLDFSNSTKGLFQSGRYSNDINFQRIYDILTGNSLGSEGTCFTELKRLLPGHYLKVENGSIIDVNYSILFERKRYKNKELESFERFRSIFMQAVNHRLLSDRIGISLSSGKDSTSVTAMVCKTYSPKSQRLFGYCFKPTLLSDEDFANPKYDETILLDYFYRNYPEVVAREVDVPPGSVLSSLETSIRIYGEPVFAASNQFWLQKMHRMMVADHCGIVLTGQGGNYTISWPPPELVKSRQHSLRSLYKRAKQKLLVDHSLFLPYLSRDFVHSIDLNHFLGPHPETNKDQLQSLLMKNSIGYTGYLQKLASLHYGFSITDPTYDKDVIDFCLSTPFDVYHNYQSSRNLVVQGLKDLLPQEIRENQIRSIQSADIRVRMHQEKDLLFDKLQFLNKNKLVTFVIETSSLIQEWEKFNFLVMSRKKLNYLLRLIQIGVFLSEMED